MHQICRRQADIDLVLVASIHIGLSSAPQDACSG
jgi:hypothetical protein